MIFYDFTFIKSSHQCKGTSMTHRKDTICVTVRKKKVKTSEEKSPLMTLVDNYRSACKKYTSAQSGFLLDISCTRIEFFA